MSRETLASLFVISALLTSCASREEWSRFRGPNGTGISNATSIPTQWTDEDYNWKVELPGVGHSSPVVWKDRIFVACGDQESAKISLVCLDTNRGNQLWTVTFPTKKHRQHPDNNFASSTPAVDDRGVVLSWSSPESLMLVALDLDGNELWKRDFGPYVGWHGSGQSPIIVDDLVIMGNDQENPERVPGMYGAEPTIEAGKSFLIAVDRLTGENRWTVDRITKLSAYSTPCLRAVGKGKSELVFSSTAHGLTGVDTATGKVNWEIDDIFKDRCVASPVLAGNLVVATYGHGMYGDLVVAVEPPPTGSTESPRKVYEIDKAVPLVPSPLVKGDRLFLWSDLGIVTSVVASSGEVIWRERVDGDFYSSPVCIRDRLYCVSKAGEVVVLSTDDKFHELARIPLGELCFTTPAISDGTMYLRTVSHLFSIGGKPRKERSGYSRS